MLTVLTDHSATAVGWVMALQFGPAVAGRLIAAVGEGWLFLVNAGSYAAVLVSPSFLRRHELHAEAPPERTRGSSKVARATA